MKFIEYIKERIEDEKPFDIICCGTDMPATLEFCDDWIITDYCKEQFGELLESEIDIYKYAISIDTVEVLYDDVDLCEQFCWAVAGYIADDEWQKLFID